MSERPPCKCHGSWPLHADDQAAALRKRGLENDRLESQNQALQEALKEAAMTVHLKHPHAGLTIGPFDSCEHALCTRYRNALSPTQETDPE